ASREDVGSRVARRIVGKVAHNADQAIHGTERLAITEALRLLAKEQGLLNIGSMEGSAVLAVLSNSGATSDDLSSFRRTGDSPGIAEDLGQVGNTNRVDCQGLRTQRCFFV